MPVGLTRSVRPVVTTLETRTTPTVSAVMPDGRLLTAETHLGQVTVTRFDASGAPDASFGIGGHAAVSFGGLAEAGGLAVTPGGTVLVGATRFDSATADSDFAIAQLTPAGGLDSSFGSNGVVATGFATAAGEPTADILGDLEIDFAGRVVVAGLGGSGFAAARFRSTGAIDPTFGVNGRFTQSSVGFPVALNLAQDGSANVVGSKGQIELEPPSPVVFPTLPPLELPPVVPGPPPPILVPSPQAPAPISVPVPVLVGGLADGTARVLGSAGALAFFPGFAGEVRTATADITGDGVPDYIGGAGPGGGPRVAVLDGRTHERIADFLAFEESFTGGVFVAAADFDGDGKAEIAVTPDQGGGPVVALFNSNGSERTRFFGIADDAFRGGARVALGDVNADGTPDAVVSAGFLGGPRIAIFDGRTLGNPDPVRLVPDFFAFESSVRNGAFVAAGDLDNDGFADLAFGGGPTGAPRVRIVGGQQLLAAGEVANLDEAPNAGLADFFAGSDASRGGARIAIRGDDLLAGDGDSGRVRTYSFNGLRGGDRLPTGEIDPFSGGATPNGTFVG